MEEGGTEEKSARKKWVWLLLIIMTFLQWIMMIWILIVFWYSESTTEDLVAGWEKLPYGIIAFISLGALSVATVQPSHVGGWLSDASLWSAILQFVGFFPLVVGLAFTILSLSKCHGAADPHPVEEVACDDNLYVPWNAVFFFGLWAFFIFVTFFFLLMDLATRTRFSFGGIASDVKSGVTALVSKGGRAAKTVHGRGKEAFDKGREGLEGLVDKARDTDFFNEEFPADNPTRIGQGTRRNGARGDARKRNRGPEGV